MEAEGYRVLLRRHDDHTHWEYPPDMDYRRAVSRFRAFVSDLERALGAGLTAQTESAIQDASFHSQVSLPGAWLRFSNFGDMAAVVGEPAFDPGLLDTVRRLLAAHGYVYMPEKVLAEPYPHEAGQAIGIEDWRTRYFDWI